ncbi:SH3 domain-containing protein [Humitalea sp. 24SJ18S-53]|uniref:SH3 domain-containing protein n=1 Tax=Humitalea sp. 24SJ18S-53 TaxID=3422307 RepID=UPI003D67AF59
MLPLLALLAAVATAASPRLMAQTMPPPVPQAASPTPPRPPTRPAAPSAQTTRPPAAATTRPGQRAQPGTPTRNPAATPARRPRTPAAAAAATAAAAAAASAAPPAPTPPPEPTPPQMGTVTGLQLPRFAALRSDEVNMRAGPGTRFPIEWTYQRRDMPVEIVREFDLWRRIRDQEGIEGWVHSSTLAGRRSFLVRGVDRDLRRRPEENSAVVARLRPGVIGRLIACPIGPWCEARVGEYRGFLKRDEIWGIGPEEIVQ